MFWFWFGVIGCIIYTITKGILMRRGIVDKQYSLILALCWLIIIGIFAIFSLELALYICLAITCMEIIAGLIGEVGKKKGT